MRSPRTLADHNIATSISGRARRTTVRDLCAPAVESTRRVAKELGVPHDTVVAALAAFLTDMRQTLCDHKRFYLPGIGEIICVPVTKHLTRTRKNLATASVASLEMRPRFVSTRTLRDLVRLRVPVDVGMHEVWLNASRRRSSLRGASNLPALRQLTTASKSRVEAKRAQARRTKQLYRERRKNCA